MIELVIFSCLVSDMKVCRQDHLTFMADNVTPFQCMLYGQAEMAKWAESHPKWKITKWTCGQARVFGKA